MEDLSSRHNEVTSLVLATKEDSEEINHREGEEEMSCQKKIRTPTVPTSLTISNIEAQPLSSSVPSTCSKMGKGTQ
jgi:hypothetical protein